MPGRRCVVQGCNNTPNPEGGISVHISPKNKSARDKWARFVRTHRANFNPQGRFMVCSEHFAEECFERSLHVEGSQRTLRPGSVPSIWRNKYSHEPSTSRSVRTRKKVINDLLRSPGDDASPLDRQETEVDQLSCASGSMIDEEDYCLQNFTLRSTPPQSGPASSLSAVDEDINDSSAQVPASGSLPTFLPMMTSTPNMNATGIRLPSSTLTDDNYQKHQRLTRTPSEAPDTDDTTSEATNYSVCPECASLKKERKKLKRKVRDMNEKISQLKDRLQKNQEDWAISFKEIEYQQPVLVTSGVLKTMLSPITYMYCW
ncbi:THAP domain-containing protein 10-like [Montipora capricornis]|uniref:THAP domain-containing protein 10-like n=1 Tax=Montipora capricornis TaxID=246305 RepID=UPI0035F17D2B